jgi:hypothetical protein
VQEDLGSLDVFEEAEAEPGTFGCPLDDAWNIRDDERAIDTERDDAEVRDQGGERVVGDFGARPRDRGDEGALADVRKAYDADVGEELEDEPYLLALAGGSRLGAARRAVVRRGELDVAAAASTALGDDELSAGLMEVGE